MAWGLTSAKLNSFASQPFIKKALKNPIKVASVLSFFFNVDYHDPNHVQEKMRKGECMETMSEFWYAGSEEYDAMCQNFQDTIRAVGKQQLTKDDDGQEWNANMVDSKMAQIILFDQLSRNCFRSQDEAFAYDPIALGLARELSRELVANSEKITAERIAIPSLEGEVYPPYLQFTVSPLMHSEEPNDHELAMELIDFSLDKVPPHLKHNFEFTKNFECDHKRVIDRFGRYPHRNRMMGRESTQEELDWLASDDVPGWAKSQ